MEPISKTDNKVSRKLRSFAEERDLNQLKKKINRTPQLLRQTLEIGAQTRDEVFDELERKFKMILENVGALVIHCDKYISAVKSLVEHSINLSQTFEQVMNPTNCCIPYAPSFSGSEAHVARSAPELQAQRYISDYYSTLDSGTEPKTASFNMSVFATRLECVRDKISADLKLLDQNAKQPLLKASIICKHIKKTINEREFIIADLNNYTNKFNHLEIKGRKNLSSRQEQNRMRYAKSMELEKLKYESINATLKVELRVFFRFFRDFLSHWFPNYFYITYTVAYTLYNFLGNCSEVRKLMNEKELTSLERCLQPLPDVVAKFHANFDPVVDYVDHFKIISCSQFYNDALMTANEAAKFQFEDNAVNGTVPTLYATAIYDYQPTEERDLSLRKGDIIQVVRKNDTHWWYGELLRTKQRGYFPVNYVETEKYL